MAYDQRIMPIARVKEPDQILAEEEHDAIWLREMFKAAKAWQASDIHIKPIQDPKTWDIHLETKMRVLGEKRLYGLITDYDVMKAVIGRLKVLARLDLSTDEKCQDEAFNLKSTRCRYRINLTPIEFGEAFVMRVIRLDEIPRLSNLGLSERLQADYKAALKKKRGLILFTGETGSGKSTTVQAGLMEVDRDKKEVLAIEQPPERPIEGVKHVPITKHVGWTSAIVAAMRSDPDIIYVGEIRDKESAQLALAAANTGHLVVSTLHAARVSGIFDRLADWGVDRRIVAENLIFATNQILAKKLCPHCRIKQDGLGCRQGKGCINCKDGITGRVPVIEYTYLPAPAKILHFDKSSFEETELKTSFYDEVYRLVEQGIIAAEELELWETKPNIQPPLPKQGGDQATASQGFGLLLPSGIGITSQRSSMPSHSL